MPSIADSDEVVSGPDHADKAEALGFQVDPDMAVAGELQKALLRLDGDVGKSTVETFAREVQEDMGSSIKRAQEQGLNSAAVVLTTDFPYPDTSHSLNVVMDSLGVHAGGLRGGANEATNAGVTAEVLASRKLLDERAGLNWIQVTPDSNWQVDPTYQKFRDDLTARNEGTVLYIPNPRDPEHPEIESIVLPTERTDVMFVLSDDLVNGISSPNERSHVIPSLLVSTRTERES